MIIISSALMQPTQTPSQCPSAPVFSPQGQLDTCPMPKHQSSTLSPTKTILSKAPPPSQWGKGGSEGQGNEEPTPAALGPSLIHLNSNSGGRNREAHPPPTSQAGARKPSWGQVANPQLPGGGRPESGCSQPPACTPMTVCILWGPRLWLLISRSTKRERGAKQKPPHSFTLELTSSLAHRAGSAPTARHAGLCPSS